jgi:superfamily II DNA/RNA helicase
MLKEKFAIAVGTPNRLSKLIEVGALSLSHLSVLIVDYSKVEACATFCLSL